MKKMFAYIFSLLLILASLAAFAAGEEAENNSTPRFMVTEYKLSEAGLSPENSAELSVTFKNYSKSKALYNIKLTLEDPNGEILTEGMPTQYVGYISAGGSYTWNVKLKATNTATVGSHDIQISSEYEDKYYSSYSSSDTLRIDIKQPVKLKYSGASLPKKVVQGETQTVEITLMNTGKSKIFNCTLDFDIDKMSSGGSTFVGDIEPAQSAVGSANLKIDGDALGKTDGKILITYEDSYGKEYKKTVKVSTVIEERVIETVSSEEEKDKKGNSLWWLFLLIGALVGGGLDFGILFAVNDRKQRKEDDLRL